MADQSRLTMLSALQYTQRTSISSGRTHSGAPHCRQFGGAPAVNGGIAANVTPKRAAPLTRIFFMPTFAANACAGTSGSQTPTPTNNGSVLRLSGQRTPAARINASPPAIRTKGAVAAQTKHQRGKLIRFRRDHSLTAHRVASSRSRARRSASRCLSGIGLIVPQKGHARDAASSTASGALHEMH